MHERSDGLDSLRAQTATGASRLSARTESWDPRGRLSLALRVHAGIRTQSGEVDPRSQRPILAHASVEQVAKAEIRQQAGQLLVDLALGNHLAHSEGSSGEHYPRQK